MPEERHDVEPKSQNATPEDTPQQEQKWRSIDWIAGGTFIAEVLWGSWWLVTQVFHWCSWNPRVSTEHFAQFYCGVGLGILSVGYLTLILWPIIFNIFKQGKDSKQDNDPRWFHARILSSGIVGGSYAFLLPAVMSLPEGGINSGGAAALRQAILLATGGLIALIALGETRRKNDNDREAAENLRIHQQDTLDQQKDHFEKQLEKQQEQYEANAFKERKAERRERYTKAVEQLGDEKAPVRMGGVYTLVGLVDEWLEEKSLSDDERFKEGQVIINNLCAYIRSPFTLTSYYDELSEDAPSLEGIYKDKKEEFYVDKAILDSEADVRLSIIKEIHDRIQGPDKNTPGAWSDFEYDFSGSTFFYPVDLTKSYYTKPINFSGSTYREGAYFSGSTYRKEAYFSGSTYRKEAYFTGSTYRKEAYFTGSTYTEEAHFYHSSYKGGANFSASSYKGWADFSDSSYKGGARFYHSSYKDGANFRSSTYQNEVYFGDSIYQDEVYFHSSTYQGWADFSDSIYQDEVYFHSSAYQGEADFSRSIFYSETYFDKDKYSNSSSCFTNRAPQFYDKKNRKNTLFGSHNNDFTVDIDKGYPINLNSEGLPLGCKFLTSEQKEYLADKFQEIDETKSKLLEVKDDEEKANLIKTLLSFYYDISNWRWEATTVKMEDVATEDTES